MLDFPRPGALSGHLNDRVRSLRHIGQEMTPPTAAGQPEGYRFDAVVVALGGSAGAPLTLENHQNVGEAITS